MMKYYAVHVIRVPADAGGVKGGRRGGEDHYNGDGLFTSSVNDGAHFVDVIINLRRARAA